jgi:membrane protein YdbS with pleckstrin-like domain
MRPEPEQHLDPKAVRLWRVHAALQSGFYAILLLAAFGLLAAIRAIDIGYVWVGPAALVGYAVAQIIVIPPLRYRYWRYRVDEHELDIRRGVFVVRRTLVPLVRVQNVDTVQGPVSRFFGLSAVTVATAAGTHAIPALSDETANALRDRISALARVARDAT